MSSRREDSLGVILEIAYHVTSNIRVQMSNSNWMYRSEVLAVAIVFLIVVEVI